jgi:hypothetical protein
VRSGCSGNAVRKRAGHGPRAPRQPSSPLAEEVEDVLEHVEGGAPAEERVEVTVAGNPGVRHVQVRLPVGWRVRPSSRARTVLRAPAAVRAQAISQRGARTGGPATQPSMSGCAQGPQGKAGPQTDGPGKYMLPCGRGRSPRSCAASERSAGAGRLASARRVRRPARTSERWSDLFIHGGSRAGIARVGRIPPRSRNKPDGTPTTLSAHVS